MAIVVGLDVHRAQVTYDALNSASGEVTTGRITPADRATLRTFLGCSQDKPKRGNRTRSERSEGS